METVTERFEALEDDSVKLARFWRPINDAPRDGTEILGWDNGVSVIHWHELARAAPAVLAELGVRQAGWRDLDGYAAEPTHWMPRPAPPEQ